MFVKVVFIVLVVFTSESYQSSMSSSTRDALFKQTFGTDYVSSSRNGPRKSNDALAGYKMKYVFSVVKVNWFKARELCETFGFRFASITSQADLQSFIDACHAESLNLERLWLGGSDLATEGSFMWASQPPEPFSFTNWYLPTTNPSNDGDGEHCVEIFPHDKFEWNDYRCDVQLSFACQRQD